MERLPIGRLERVNVRACWPHEAQDFTPWLTREENLTRLGEALGIDLELVDNEVRVGPYRADLVCRDRVDGGMVLVENQFGGTDHRHLGQLLTYGAGLDAFCVVWLAERFGEEHRAALDWLNRITEDRFAFFGVELTLWRIGESPVAPRFEVICRPNVWARAVRRASAGGSGESRYQDWLGYWEGFSRFAKEQGYPLPLPTPAARNWVELPWKIPGVRVTASCSLRTGVAKIFVIFRSAEQYEAVRGRAGELASAVGQELEWNGSHFVLVSPRASDVPTGSYAWLLERSLPLHRALSSLLEHHRPGGL